MFRNAEQLLAIVRAAYPDFDTKSELIDCSEVKADVDELACWWRKSLQAYKISKTSGIEHVIALDLLHRFSTRCQDILSMAASNYNLSWMSAGMVVTFFASLLSIFNFIPVLENSKLANLFLPAITLAYGIMMFASSYVEEEHHFWYWVASGWFIAIFINKYAILHCLQYKVTNRNTDTSKSVHFHPWRFWLCYEWLAVGIRQVCTVAVLEYYSLLTIVGQKHAGASDISKDFLQRYPGALWCLVITTYSVIFLRLSNRTFRRAGREVAFIFAFTIMASALAFKFAFAAQDTPELIPWDLVPVAKWMEGVPLVNLARATLGATFAGVIYTVFFELRASTLYSMFSSRIPCRLDGTNRLGDLSTLNAAAILMDFFMVFLVTQTRLVNIPLFSLFQIVAWVLGTMHLSATEITISTMILEYFSFFAFGGANAISSVDLSNAYNGVSGYNVVVVAILTFTSNWIGPIYWSCVGIILLARKRILDESAFLRHTILLTMFHCIAVVFVMAACTILRTHLFIWTVFSPKFLYSMAWVLGFHMIVNLGVGGLMGWASKKSLA